MTDMCAKCSKTAADAGNPLKVCSKCKSIHYCSRDCQKDHWKVHKKVCATNANANIGSTINTSSSATNKGEPLEVHIEKPFHKLNDKTWLHNRSEKDVQKLLIDIYRLRMDDTFKFDHMVENDSLYSGARDGTNGFRNFLALVEGKAGLLPADWSAEKKEAVIAFGQAEPEKLLFHKADKETIIGRYGNSQMPIQMRLFGEQVYGRGVGGQAGAPIIQLQMQMESGALHGSTINANRYR
ncbi:hypothetical protein BGZ47_002344 [Haplosporangium gracile]|nr:hypothetical protein BGZ47_002344 [Haplosporangium gracile]